METERALRESERRFRAVTETAVDAIITTDHAGVILTWNRTAETVFGLGATEAVGKPLGILLPDDDDGSPGLDRMLGEVGFVGRTIELTCEHASGEEIPVEVSLSRWAASGESHYTFIMRNFAERQRAEEERAALTAQFHRAQRMEAIGTLAGGIAHDFNNILGIILGYADVAKLELEEASPVGAYLDHIIGAGERARDLVQQILSFSRDDEGDFRPVHVEHLVKETLTLLRATLPTTLELRRDVHDRLKPVLADAGEIHQVLMNLIVNAYHAIGERPGTLSVGLNEREIDGGRVSGLLSAETTGRRRTIKVVSEADGKGGSVWVDVLDPGPHIAISVEDDGAGMDFQTLERIFEPFFTTKEVGQGTGLGLAAVEGIVARHNGAMRVKSERGTGTIFTVLLPALDEDAKTRMPDAGTGEALPTGKERILVVDDEPLLVKLPEQSLGRLGYRVDAMTDPAEALSTFRQDRGHWDLGVTDQTMPRMTGTELARNMLSLRRDLPVIICTGYSEKVDQADADALGVRALITKPVGGKTMVRIIRESFDK